jgi:hypothetical protein
MGLFDGGRRQRQLDANRSLNDLSARKPRSASRRANRDMGNMLRSRNIVNAARNDSHTCSMRISYLKVLEPEPQTEDFAPFRPPTLPYPAVLARKRGGRRKKE